MMTSLLAAALEYAGRGWAVFPVEPRSKKPLGKLVPHGLKDATTDPNLIVKWWKAAPEANIGLVTGIEFDVLDVDEPGWGSLARLVDQNSPLAIGPTAITPGNGCHYLFTPTGSGNRAAFRPGLDWRGAGGYIVAPPSVHPNGGQYTWAIAPGEEPLIAPPTWLVDALKKPTAPNSRVSDTSARITPYGMAALEREVGRVVMAAVGQRNDTLNHAAFRLAQLVPTRHLTLTTIGDALLDAAMRSGLGEAEAEATIKSGLKAGVRSPRQVAS